MTFKMFKSFKPLTTFQPLPSTTHGTGSSRRVVPIALYQSIIVPRLLGISIAGMAVSDTGVEESKSTDFDTKAI
jgi:hypothetical protein